MTPEIRKAAKLLLDIWHQYAMPRSYVDEDGATCLPHSCMCAGEAATEWLESLGLAVDTGYAAKLTAAGQELLDSDD